MIIEIDDYYPKVGYIDLDYEINILEGQGRIVGIPEVRRGEIIVLEGNHKTDSKHYLLEFNSGDNFYYKQKNVFIEGKCKIELKEEIKWKK